MPTQNNEGVEVGSQLAAQQEEAAQLSKDTLYELLKNSRRRESLRFLFERGETTTLSDVAEHVAAKENDTEVRLLSSAERKRVYIGLYQCHLPKMDRAGVIDFDKDRGNIELTAAADQLRRHLYEADEPATAQGDAAADAEPETDQVTETTPTTPDTDGTVGYAALATGVVLAVVAAGGAVGAPLLGAVSPVAVALVAAAALVAHAGYELRR
jgi:Mn-containing catalase